MAEKALADDEANALLRRRVAELEEANARLQSELDTSRNTAALLQLGLDAEAEHGKRLKHCNVCLFNERSELWNCITV
jgi:hypothetical protein